MGNYDSRAGDKLRDALAGLLSFASEDDRNLLYDMLSLGCNVPIHTFSKLAASFTNGGVPADDTAAATEIAATGLMAVSPFNAFPWVAGASTRQVRIIGARALATTATGLVLNDTDYKTIRVNHVTAAGATSTAAIAATTQTVATDPNNSTGTWPATALTNIPLPAVQTSGAIVAAGGSLTAQTVKTGNGVVIPGCIISVFGAPA